MSLPRIQSSPLARAAVVALLALAAIAVLAPAQPAAAAGLSFQLDPQATRVTFGFGATLHSVEGKIRAVGGTFRYDPENASASGDMTLDMTSAETGNSRRDRKMHEKILESDRFPRAVFHLQRVSGNFRREGDSDVLLHGVLDFHGTSHMIDLPVTAHVRGAEVTADGEMTIPYVDWGLRDPSFFILRVEKEVKVDVHAVGKLTG